MESVEEILQSCRLCLVKEQVNIPIFEESSDLRKISEKINSCLPVKVAKDDNLPKKICDGCSYKLDMVYLFRNTSVDSEKQLIQWLTKAGLTNTIFNSEKDAKTSEILVKQESYDGNEVQNDLGADAHTYIMQQQKLPYQQDFAFPESSAANEEENGPLPKRPKRESAAKKKPPIVESEEEDDDDDDDFDNSMDVPKAEDNYSDEEEDRTDFDAPSTSADAQPGPSGVGTSEAPLKKKSIKTKKEKFESNDEDWDMPLKPKNKSKQDSVCPYCFKLCTGYSLASHILCHGEKQFECYKCMKRFRSIQHLQRHEKTIHAKKVCTFKCEFCDKEFALETYLKSHRNRVHIRNFIAFCEICKAGFCNKGSLKAHHKASHMRSPCDICGKMFLTDYLDKHKISKHSETLESPAPKFSCRLCEKEYVAASALSRHISVIHKGNDSVICDTCGKSYNGHYKLKRHMRTHTEETKTHECKFCKKMFRSKFMLHQHERVHTGERPYVCSTCGKGFTQSTPLKVHQRTHRNNK